MTHIIRFTLDPALPVTTPDAHPAVLRGIEQDGAALDLATGSRYPLGAVRLLPPCSPSKIVCVGRNYAAHAKELGNEVPAEPLIFLKPPSSLNAHGGAVVFPRLSSQLSYEGELALVIGRRARRVPLESAWECIAGFTVLNDFTARDLQKKDGQWTRGKGFDTFCPVGPWIVPRQEVDFDALRVRTYVNGELKQDGPVTDMIFGPAAVVHYVTQFLTLEPGDLIATGTPPGVGQVEPGATVRVEIAGVAVLENQVVAED
jgi:2-keto-4-pentenoate hydratase/2-oxohepta-3-ene-1,7-dioic acid hydratase in catechol pathway